MRIAIAQLNYVIGDFGKNVQQIISTIQKAKADRADLIVFAELCVCGYPPRDFLEFADFNQRCLSAAEEIAKECKGIQAIIGLPLVNPVLEGKGLFNSACLLSEGKILATVHKSLLPNYDIFDEYRYFEPGRSFPLITVNGVKIALTVCEDLWNVEDDPMYVSCPMDELIKEQPQLMINIAASPFDYAHAEKRLEILLRNVRKYNLPLVYVNHVGAQTELIFDGGSLGISKSGDIIKEMNYFVDDYALVEFDTFKSDLTSSEKIKPHHLITQANPLAEHIKISRIHHALVLGIRDYFSKLEFTEAILGLSGGIDSAVVTYLAMEALGKDHVKVLLMPSMHSSAGSVDDSIALIRQLGIKYETIPIAPIYEQYVNALQSSFAGKTEDVTEENLQARIRGALLMAESNKFKSILLNTSNKSEIAVGYGTLYGDMCGGLSVIGDLYKTEVFELARYINREKEIIPEAIISKAPSAELRPNQKDSDSLPDYEVLDPILFQYIENRQGPDELIRIGFDKAMVERVLKMVNTNEYKRYQTPPILRVSLKAFGMGRRLPIVGKYLS